MYGARKIRIELYLRDPVAFALLISAAGSGQHVAK